MQGRVGVHMGVGGPCAENRGSPEKGKGEGAVRAREVGARSRGPALGKGLCAGEAECLARWGRHGGLLPAW